MWLNSPEQARNPKPQTPNPKVDSLTTQEANIGALIIMIIVSQRLQNPLIKEYT